MTIFAGIISCEASKFNAYKDELSNIFKIATNSLENHFIHDERHAFFGFEADEIKIKKTICETDNSFCWISGKAIFDDIKESQNTESNTVLKHHLNGKTSLRMLKLMDAQVRCQQSKVKI